MSQHNNIYRFPTRLRLADEQRVDWTDENAYVDPDDQLARIKALAEECEREWIKIVWRRRIENACIAIALLSAVYFTVQLVRAAL